MEKELSDFARNVCVRSDNRMGLEGMAVFLKTMEWELNGEEGSRIKWNCKFSTLVIDH